VNMAGQDTQPTLISAYSKRQVMDWSLVLASQDIPATIIQTAEAGWALVVEPQDYERALGAIRQYRVENRHWAWRQPIPWSGATFHYGAVGWCFLLILVHWLTLNRLPDFAMAGALNSTKALNGEWWRVFTAILLHNDLGHLLANTTIGLLLFGLAMARYGAGVGLFAAYLAGVMGNLAGLWLHPKPYVGLGASGMVMGALGLITIPPFSHWSSHPRALKQLLQAAFASIMLFVLLGVAPSSDVIAHLGGFVAGAILGVALNFRPATALRDWRFTTVAWVVFATLVTLTGWLALKAT
jgi:membrane associated rhomboid family serine protease